MFDSNCVCCYNIIAISNGTKLKKIDFTNTYICFDHSEQLNGVNLLLSYRKKGPLRRKTLNQSKLF